MSRKHPSPARRSLPTRRRGANLAVAALAFGLGVVLLFRPTPGKPAALPAPAAVPVQSIPPASGPVLAARPDKTEGVAAATRPVADASPPADAVAAGDDGSVVYRRAVDAVAWLVVWKKGEKLGMGTGVRIDAARVLTAWHVVKEAEIILALFPARDGGGEVIGDYDFYADQFERRCHLCTLAAGDAGRDLALLRLGTPPPGPPVALAATAAVPGQWLFCIGNPAAPAVRWRCASGGVRQVHRDTVRFPDGQIVTARVLETSVPVTPGYSGSPLLNRAGELVGLVVTGMEPTWPLVQKSIDLTEIRAFLGTAEDASHGR